jgi:hypothetical protein
MQTWTCKNNLHNHSRNFTRVNASSLTLTARVAKRGFCNFWATAERSWEACVRRSEFMLLSICTKDGLKVLVNLDGILYQRKHVWLFTESAPIIIQIEL